MSAEVLIVALRPNVDRVKAMKELAGHEFVAAISCAGEGMTQRIAYLRARADLQELLWNALTDDSI